MRCDSSKKVIYTTQEQAEEALIFSRSQYASSSQGPVAIYQCPDCGGFHLTSKGSENTLLQSSKAQDEIKLKREASYWEDKFKRK